MTPHSILKVNFREIASIELTCLNCRGAVVIPLPTDNIPHDLACPACNKQLWGQSSTQYAAILGIIRSISHWKRMENVGFDLGFSLVQ
jgi:hypothetical protein